MSKLKTGRWSKEEENFIKEQAQTLSIEQMAKRLNRSSESIKERVRMLGLHLKGLEAYQYDAERDLRTSEHWQELQDQLTPDELSFFLAQWKKVISQFRDDVYETEKLQVIDLIKVEILMNRCMKQQKNNQSDIETFHRLLEAEKQKDIEDRNMQNIQNWQAMLTALASASDSLVKSFRELLREKKSIFEKLKATREQRIEKLEASKETAAGWIRSMLLDPDVRKTVGKRIEKLRLATEVELIRLSEMHTYEDGTVDRPILTPESVRGDEE